MTVTKYLDFGSKASALIRPSVAVRVPDGYNGSKIQCKPNKWKHAMYFGCLFIPGAKQLVKFLSF